MVAAGLPLRFVALQAPGMYDPHDDQAGGDGKGNLKPTADYRGLYAALLEQWLAASFARPALIA